MTQDSKGFIWIGTLGGLSRFDGRSFKNFDRQKGLLNNQINCIIELTDGTIVAGSNGSISFINGLGIRNVQLENEFRESTVNALHEYGGEIWIGMENGLLRYSNQKRQFIPLGKEFTKLDDQHIKSFQNREAGGLFVLTKEKLFLSEETGLSVFFQPENSETGFFDVAISKDEVIWLASKGEGLIRLSPDGKKSINYLDHAEFSTNLITGIMIDKNGHIWMTSRFGFYEFDGTTFESFTERSGLKTHDIRDILQDNEGNIWLGTYGGGILKFTGRAFSSYTIKDGLPSDAIMSVIQDTTGSFWFSSFDKGICRMTDDTIIQYQLEEWTDNNRIWSSLKDHEGSLWFGSSDGLFRYQNGKFSLFTEKDSLSHAMILALFEDTQNRIWIGTNKGLTVYEKGSFRRITDMGSPQKKVRCIRQDKGGHLWFASIDGVFHYDGIIFKAYAQKDGLSENSSNCLEIDKDNRIWVGSQNGISILGSKQFSSAQIDETSGSNVINFLKYLDEKMWIGTNNGIYSCAISDQLDETRLSFKHYGLEDGLRGLETNLNAVYSDEMSRLWFGTTEGITNLNTAELSRPRGLFAPQLNIVNVQINLQDVDWSKGFPALDSTNGIAINPAFFYRQNHLTFYFKAISLTYPEGVEYQYMLEGLDEDWKPVTKIDFATYSNLPFSSFIFKVKARSAKGIWCEPISYAFSITPPFWLRWWFVLLEIAGASAILGFVIYNRRKALIEKREKEWFQIKSKMLALEQQSLNSSMNRHFIFNALNSIQYYINRQDRLAANKYLSDFARLIRKNLDSSEDNLTTLRDEIERLELYLKLEHMRFKDKFEYRINTDPALNLDQIRVPAMLIQPFLENSIWHGLLPKDSMGQVSIDIEKQQDSLQFTITDNGIGIENSLKNKTTADNHISKGMEITQSRIELIKKSTGQNIELHGPYQLQQDGMPAEGTQVRIKLPLNFHELF